MLGIFSLGWACYVTNFFFFYILVQIFFFWAFSFCLKVEQIMEQNLILLALKKKKKTEGVPKIFLKGRQIKNFKLLYINFFFFLRSRWSQDHPNLTVVPSLLFLILIFALGYVKERSTKEWNGEHWVGVEWWALSVCLDTNEKLKLFYYSTYFCYYPWASLHFLVLFMSPIVLFQLTFTFFYSTFGNKFSISAK